MLSFSKVLYIIYLSFHTIYDIIQLVIVHGRIPRLEQYLKPVFVHWISIQWMYGWIMIHNSDFHHVKSMVEALTRIHEHVKFIMDLEIDGLIRGYQHHL